MLAPSPPPPPEVAEAACPVLGVGGPRVVFGPPSGLTAFRPHPRIRDEAHRRRDRPGYRVALSVRGTLCPGRPGKDSAARRTCPEVHGGWRERPVVSGEEVAFALAVQTQAAPLPLHRAAGFGVACRFGGGAVPPGRRFARLSSTSVLKSEPPPYTQVGFSVAHRTQYAPTPTFLHGVSTRGPARCEAPLFLRLAASCAFCAPRRPVLGRGRWATFPGACGFSRC